MSDEVESQAPTQPQRLLSLDAYRGGVMFVLAGASVASLTPALGKAFFPDSEVWKFLSTQWGHAAWRISTDDWQAFHFQAWDMIQPAFMFMVGVSMPFSYGKRRELGHSYRRMLGHAVYRAVVLILLGVFLRSLSKPQTYWTFEDVISQIGLGYVFLFLLWNRSWKVQAIAAAVILVGYWALWQFQSGWPWMVENKPPEGNPAQAFDVWFLNLFPREHRFENHYYYTLNFIPSLATMIFGLMSGHLLRGDWSASRKLSILLVTGLAGVLLGLAADWIGICPIIKKIWTPSWTLFSGGWCVLILAGLYGIIDVLGFRRWTLLFVVFGVNSIAIYILHWTWKAWLQGNVRKHLTPLLPTNSPAWSNLIVALITFALLWLLFYWMYRRKMFLRI